MPKFLIVVWPICSVTVLGGYDFKIACAKFQGNQFIIDGEIDKKYALQNY